MYDDFLNYSDVYLVPKYSELESRSLADVSIDFLGYNFKLPVVPSNSLDVINEEIALNLRTNSLHEGTFTLYGRF